MTFFLLSFFFPPTCVVALLQFAFPAYVIPVNLTPLKTETFIRVSLNYILKEARRRSSVVGRRTLRLIQTVKPRGREKARNWKQIADRTERKKGDKADVMSAVPGQHLPSAEIKQEDIKVWRQTEQGYFDSEPRLKRGGKKGNEELFLLNEMYVLLFLSWQRYGPYCQFPLVYM